MRIALGIIISPGFRADTDFMFGRPDHPDEGFYALTNRIVSGDINHALSDAQRITGFRLILSRKFPTDVARNEICAEVLKGDEDYLLFLDADMVHPADLPERLLQADKPVVTGRYQLKKAPFATVAYVKHRTQTTAHAYASVHFGQGVFEIERGGAGALLIRRDVLTAIYDRQGHNWFRYQRGPEPPHEFTVSEDFWFYQQAREAGFRCFIDWDCICQHLGLQAIDDTWNTPFLHAQVGDYAKPEVRDLVMQNTIVRGYPGGIYLGEHGDEATRIPEYELTEGER